MFTLFQNTLADYGGYVCELLSQSECVLHIATSPITAHSATDQYLIKTICCSFHLTLMQLRLYSHASLMGGAHLSDWVGVQQADELQHEKQNVNVDVKDIKEQSGMYGERAAGSEIVKQRWDEETRD